MMGDFLRMMDVPRDADDALGAAALGLSRSHQSHAQQPSVALGQADSSGAAEAVQICQMLQEIEATLQHAPPHPALAVQQQAELASGAGPTGAPVGESSQPQHLMLPTGAANSSVFQAAAAARQQQHPAAAGLLPPLPPRPPIPQQQQQQQQAQGPLAAPLTIQRQTVQVVAAQAPVPTLVPPTLATQHLQHPHLPAISVSAAPSVRATGAAAATLGGLEGLPGFPAHHLLQPLGTPTAAGGSAAVAGPPKDAAAAARAARQRKRKEMAAEKVVPAAASQEAAAAHAVAAAAVAGVPCGVPVTTAAPTSSGFEAGGEVEGGVVGMVGMAGGEGSVGDQLDSMEGGSDERAQRRMIKNRESAARSRARRQEYTAALENQVAQLRQTNRDLRVQVVLAAAAPADPHAGRLEGQLLRRTRTTPL